MASVFSRHESNSARLGRSRKTSCWPPTTPQTLQELERALLEEWDRIPQLVINSLIDSMPQSESSAALGFEPTAPSEQRLQGVREHDILTTAVPLRHGGTLKSRRAARPLVWLVEGVEKWEAPLLPQKLGWKLAKSSCHLYGAQSYS
ncbi:hypothetical protein TNCV_2797631 [Trichonephila clavipes]|nr:hypothetical protein TNCV_2797631 [Trichonephila clavipes]